MQRSFLRILFRCVAIVLLASAAELSAQNYIPGVSYFGRSNYIEYIAGELPVIISEPHGGSLLPPEIPDRTYGTFATDSNTEDLARKIRTEFGNRFGLLPHVIMCRLDRDKIDCNREIIEGAQGDPEAEQAWNEFHNFTGYSVTNVTQRHGRGFYIDVHGHGHAVQRLELGYLLTDAQLNLSDATLNGSATYQNNSSIRTLSVESPLSFAALLRGSNSFGGLIGDEGYPSVPSPATSGPGADPYFNGGYNTDRYGSDDGGNIDALQIESNYDGVRDTSGNRTTFAQSLARVMDRYFFLHHDVNLRESLPKAWVIGGGSFGTGGNWLNGFLPVSTNQLLFAGAGGALTHNLAALTTGAGIVGAVTFSNAPTGGYTMSGNAMTLLRGITNNSGVTQTINNPITLAGPQSFVASSGTLALGGNVTNAGYQLHVLGNVIASGVLSGTGGVTKSGSGTLALQTVNSYTGPTTNQSGTISLNATSTFGDGTGLLVLGGGDVLSLNTRSGSPIANPILLTGSSTISGNGTLTNSLRVLPFSSTNITTPSGSLTLRHTGSNPYASNNVFRVRLSGGGFTFTRPVTIGFVSDLPSTLTQLESYNDDAAGDQTFSGSISGTGQFRRDAANAGTAGRTILSGVNSYSGGTIVGAGTLLVNNPFGSGTGTGFVVVSNNATLGGNGTVGGPVVCSGNVSPGESVGLLTLDGGLDLSAGGTLEWELAAPTNIGAGVNWDQLALTAGELVLGGTAELKLIFLNASATPNAGDPFWLMSHEWKIVALSGTATNVGPIAFPTIVDGSFPTGAFTNYADTSGSIWLRYVATPATPPVFQAIAVQGNGDLTLSFSAETNRTYILQSRTDLTASAWQNLSTNVATGPILTLTNLVATDPVRFFRVVVAP